MNRQLKVSLIALGILAIGVLGFKGLEAMKEKPQKKKTTLNYRLVKTMQVTPDTLTRHIPINGRIQAAEKVEVFPEVTGTLLRSGNPFKVGQSFKQGDVMLALDGTESLLNLKSQRSAFMNLIAQLLPDIKLDYEKSFPTWAAYSESLDPNKTLPKLPEVKDSQLKNLLSARNLNQQFFAIRSLENRQSKFVITAPFSGSVTQGSANAGTVLRAGQKVGEFTRTSGYEFEAAIAVKDADGISTGQKITLNNGLSGKLIRVARSADPNSQRVNIYASLDGEADVREGVFLEGTLEMDALPNTVSIDRNLITNDQSVFIVTDTVLSKRAVEVLHQFEGNAIIRGVQPDDILLDQVIEGAYEGMLVKTESK